MVVVLKNAHVFFPFPLWFKVKPHPEIMESFFAREMQMPQRFTKLIYSCKEAIVQAGRVKLSIGWVGSLEFQGNKKLFYWQ